MRTLLDNKLLQDEKNTATAQATKLYEALGIKRQEFIAIEQIGAIHEKQMQDLYKDFNSGCTLFLK